MSVTPDPPSDAPTSPRRTDLAPWWRRRWRPVLRWTGLVLGLIGVGASLTYLLAPPVAAPPTVNVIDPAPVLDEVATLDEQSAMPSVVGLSTQTAELAIRDASTGVVDVTTTTKVAAGPAGQVLDQNPAAGEPFTGTVALTVSRPARMPDLAQETFDDAVAELERLGAIVRTEQVVRPALALGTVLSSDPGPGSPVPVVVTLQVTDPGESVPLTDLYAPAENGCFDAYDVEMDGFTATTAVVCPVRARASSIAYRVNGLGMVVTFNVGLRAEQSASATVDVIGDGAVLATFPVASTAQRRVVPVSGVRTVRLEVTGSGSADVVLGNAAVRGTPDQIAKLADQ